MCFGAVPKPGPRMESCIASLDLGICDTNFGVSISAVPCRGHGFDGGLDICGVWIIVGSLAHELTNKRSDPGSLM